MERKYTIGIMALAMFVILGVGLVSANGLGMWNSKLSDEERALMQEHRDAMQEAVESGDYDAWKTLMNEKTLQMQEKINEDTFNEIKERHNDMTLVREAVEDAKESGDWSEVEALKLKLGIEGKGFGERKGLHEGSKKGIEGGHFTQRGLGKCGQDLTE